MTTWTWLWIGWGIAFLAIEIPAFIIHRGGTLSAHVWRWITRPRQGWKANAAAWAGRAAVAALLVWLLGHMLFGVWTL